jgi:uncharacterized protein with PIN domain
MGKKDLLRSEDGKCPHCDSDFVLKTDKKEKVDDPSCEAEVVIWKCYRCNKRFYCVTP